MTPAQLREYANLVVRTGVNVQKGQTLIIGCPVDSADFARLLAEEAYDAGAREVVVRWTDELMNRMKYLRADDAVFDEVPKWLLEFYNGYGDLRAPYIAVVSDDPELLKGVDPDRIQRWARASGTALKSYYEKQMNNEFPWCIASVPSPVWAKKVFPDETGENAVARLWAAILKTVHVGGGNAVDVWREKVDTMTRRAKMFTEYNFRKLIYRNALGTDLTVGLPEGHEWIACGEKTRDGIPFVANMPTEEIFTLPRRDEVNGVLYASKPLALDGHLVRDIVFTFKDGKITDAKASSGLDILERAIHLDDGARYLGELSLVPYHSPISDMDVLFYNTLFDENASCHFAFGKAYPAFADKDLSEEEKTARGANDSITHVDFMVGTEDLSVTGITQDGREVPVFVAGDFAF